ncbi:enoyl-CoA hydratase/isomerase family protein [Dermatobacter hominis]|uniref:enoyl-CoA hydratase/isomerase family protein n=1 Tax=Dermatobacter hominis TaxID=2884263 RepID=UPI001D118B75|nr:enoyl-CoA hydratase/isomerase family protein [Dermatobacter hominis]UDY37446.1 enoyl-CoA hydratase/isomerase family protein [Dermatobacter hominis]
MPSAAGLADLELTTVTLDVADGVATVTLDRPDVYNSFDPTMTQEVATVWQALRHADEVRAVVLTASGDKAFCTGIDRDSVEEFGLDPFTYEDPGRLLGPKSQGLWKPVIAAVNGMACGGAFYFLAEADVILAAEHATFFDPHVTYGMVAAYEPILLLRRMPFGDVLRMAITGAHERIGAETAQRIGLVSEVLPADELRGAAHDLAAVVASQPAVAVQATVRTLWAARDLPGLQATDLGNLFLELGTSTEALLEGQEVFSSGKRIVPKVR